MSIEESDAPQEVEEKGGLVVTSRVGEGPFSAQHGIELPWHLGTVSGTFLHIGTSHIAKCTRLFV